MRDGLPVNDLERDLQLLTASLQTFPSKATIISKSQLRASSARQEHHGADAVKTGKQNHGKNG